MPLGQVVIKGWLNLLLGSPEAATAGHPAWQSNLNACQGSICLEPTCEGLGAGVCKGLGSIPSSTDTHKKNPDTS